MEKKYKKYKKYKKEKEKKKKKKRRRQDWGQFESLLDKGCCCQEMLNTSANVLRRAKYWVKK